MAGYQEPLVVGRMVGAVGHLAVVVGRLEGLWGVGRWDLSNAAVKGAAVVVGGESWSCESCEGEEGGEHCGCRLEVLGCW